MERSEMIFSWCGVFAVIAAICATACSHSHNVAPTPSQGDPSTASVWWSPALHLSTTAMVDSRLGAPFEAPIDVVKSIDANSVDRKVMTSCLSYFALRTVGYEPESDGDTAAMKLEGAKCQAIRALRESKPAQRASLEGFRLDNGALQKLPPALGPESSPADVQAREAATRFGKTWQAYEPLAHLGHVVSPQEAEVMTPESTTEIKLLVRGDLTGDGADDILIQTLSFGTEGSWREVRLRLLTRDGDKPVLRILKEYSL
jgi:hypothetical protein